jgi:C4-type Zn-finger protein
MVMAKLTMVIDCPVCKAQKAMRVYEIRQDSDYWIGIEVNCWECGFKTAFTACVE